MRKKTKVVNDFERSSQTYFKEISSFKSLSREEEFSLWEKYRKENDLIARDKLIKSNLKFVASGARGYQGLGRSYSDLIAEGNYGLMKAFDKFLSEQKLTYTEREEQMKIRSRMIAKYDSLAIKVDELEENFKKLVNRYKKILKVTEEKVDNEFF